MTNRELSFGLTKTLPDGAFGFTAKIVTVAPSGRDNGEPTTPVTFLISAGLGAPSGLGPHPARRQAPKASEAIGAQATLNILTNRNPRNPISDAAITDLLTRGPYVDAAG
ncbi:MAG: hypothetical protein NVS9B1_08760 [Candidatus Dormibacteraceae bacterium]